LKQQNVEVRNPVVQAFFAAFDTDARAFRETLDPAVEWFPIEENRTPTRGIEAAMANRNAWLETWDEHRLELEEVVEQGDDVVALVHISARGAAAASRSTFASTPGSGSATEGSSTSSTTRAGPRRSRLPSASERTRTSVRRFSPLLIFAAPCAVTAGGMIRSPSICPRCRARRGDTVHLESITRESIIRTTNAAKISRSSGSAAPPWAEPGKGLRSRRFPNLAS
jgi:hypothetical protein